MNYTYLWLTKYLFSHCTIQGHLYHYIRFTFHFSPIAPQLRTTVPVTSVQCRISSRHCTSPSSWRRPHTNSPSLRQMDKSGHGLWLDMIRPRQQGQEASQWACNLPLIEDSCCCSGPFQMLCSDLVWSGLAWSGLVTSTRLAAHCDWWLSRSQLSVRPLMWHHQQQQSSRGSSSDFLWVAWLAKVFLRRHFQFSS